MSTHTSIRVQDVDRVLSLYMELDAKVRETAEELSILEQLRDSVWQKIQGVISTPSGASKCVDNSSSDSMETGRKLLASKDSPS